MVAYSKDDFEKSLGRLTISWNGPETFYQQNICIYLWNKFSRMMTFYSFMMWTKVCKPAILAGLSTGMT